MAGKQKKQIFVRSILVFICLILIAAGIRSILQGDMTYKNYWGGMVFGPAAIAVGILFIYVIIFRWAKVNTLMVDKKGRKIRFPSDDFRKW
jgi:uncharacterized membrane protein